MTDNTDTLREIFLDLADVPTLIERQEATPSHDPIDGTAAALEERLTVAVRNDGLDDAIDSGFDASSAATG